MPAEPADADADADAEHTLCRLCNERPRRVLWTACGHFVACRECHERVVARSAKCVVCRARIVDGAGVREVDASSGLVRTASYQPDQVDEALAELARPTPEADVAAHVAAAAAGVLGDDAAARLAATEALLRLTWNEEARPHAADAVAAAGLLPRLVAALGADDAPVLQQRTAELLVNIAAGEQRHGQALVDAGALPALVRLLRERKERPVADAAAWCLSNVALCGPEVSAAVLAAGAVPPLVALLEPGEAPSAERRLRAIKCLTSLVFHGTTPLDAVRPALPAMLRSLATEVDEQTLHGTLLFLATVTKACDDDEDGGDKERPVAVLEAGGAAACARLAALAVAAGSPLLDVLAAATLANLATADPPQLHILTAAGVLPALLPLLRDTDGRLPEWGPAWACRLACDMAAQSQHHVQAVLDAGFVPDLLRRMGDGEPAARRYASMAISNLLIIGTEAQKNDVLQHDVVTPICAVLASDDAVAVRATLAATHNVLLVGEARRAAAAAAENEYVARVDRAGGVPRVSALQSHDDETIRAMASVMLRRYFQPPPAAERDGLGDA